MTPLYCISYVSWEIIQQQCKSNYSNNYYLRMTHDDASALRLYSQICYGLLLRHLTLLYWRFMDIIVSQVPTIRNKAVIYSITSHRWYSLILL